MVFFALENALGGEIFVPKIPSYRITEVAKAIGPDCEHPVVGIRPGEKLHEEMITASDSQNTIETKNYYVIVPNSQEDSYQSVMERYLSHYKAKHVAPGFCYSSGENTDWLNAEQIRDLIKKHVDPSFEAA
jgi:FlaA1/EpsC-like NDP-sugar epimerase